MASKTDAIYRGVDPYKLKAMAAARTTEKNIKRLGMEVVPWTRGESCLLYRNGNHFIGQVHESLGTKNLIPDPTFDTLAQCTIAMAVNDLVTLGALPVGLSQYLSVGNADWFKNHARATALIDGWKLACNLARCAWGPGDTPALKGVVMPGEAELSASVFGKTLGKKVINPANIQAGDEIIFCTSSGIHGNGLTDARALAEHLPRGYRAKIPGEDRTYREALLVPTFIYVRLIEALLQGGVIPHYAVNITGHGWRKLMRAQQRFTYVIERMPPEQALFTLMEHYLLELGLFDIKKMYATFNMGAGFALYIGRRDLPRFWKIVEAGMWPFKVIPAGHIEEGPKRVVIQPLGITFKARELAIR